MAQDDAILLLRDEIPRPSTKPVIALLVAIGVALISVADALFLMDRAVPIATMIFGLAASLYALDRWKPQVGRWFSIAALIVVTVLLTGWPLGTGALALLVVPTALAAALLGLAASFWTALAETALLVLLAGAGGRGAGAVNAWIAMAAIWAIVGAMFMTYRAVYGLAEWAQRYYERAVQQWQEMGSHRVRFQQITDDLMRVNRQLELTNERLAAARLVAEEAQKAKAAFVANVSHEFRTPLNMIIGLTDLLIETPDVYGGELPPTLLEDLGIVHRNCEHLASMVNDVLDLSQVEAGRLALSRERLQLKGVVDWAATLVRPLLDKKGLDLRVVVPDELPEVLCDRVRISQVVVNLLSNAARYTEVGGVTVQVAVEDGYLGVSVTDTGSGISEEDAGRIFEPFSQGMDAARQGLRGSGLGLSISKHFVELHGGQMWFESVVGRGSTFHFTIPVAPMPETLTGPSRWLSENWTWIERTTAADLPVSSAKSHMLVCDSAGELYSLCARYMDEYDCVEVKDVAAIAEQVQQVPADAMLLNAPNERDLWEMIKGAKRQIPDTPIIGCCLPHEMEPAHGDLAGYLVKPVTRSQLQQAIERLGVRVRSVLVVDDDPDTCRLLSRMLIAWDGSLQVRVARTGRDALGALQANPADLVLLDIVLPDISGWEVMEEKRADRALQGIPVIALSAQDMDEQPKRSSVLMATMGPGLSISQLLRCSRALSKMLLAPDAPHEPVHP